MLLEHQQGLWFGHECSGHRKLLEHERNYGLGMDALVTVCSWNTNGIMFWAWMLWLPYALGTRTELWFGHGCSGHRMLHIKNKRAFRWTKTHPMASISIKTNISTVLIVFGLHFFVLVPKT